MNLTCPECGGELKPTGAVTDTNPAIIHFQCEKCKTLSGIFEDELEAFEAKQRALLKNPISE